jgi:eukaryotic-like serine/threonine-protein kinase
MEQGPVLAGRYVLSGLLGRGGMAEVHRAHDLRLDRDVAVKVLRASQAADEAFRGRFRREALSAASLGHPGVVAVFDAGEGVVDGVELPFIVMEHVEGRTLADLVRRGPKPDVAEAVRLTAGVLNALEHAHEHGIVHRDIKPANVMVTPRDEVKVMDFGIARPLGVSGMTVTGTAMVVGTAEYLSPEQARGLAVDERSDLYSAGCLLYELLTGRPPFVADSVLAVAWKHIDEEPSPPSVYAPGVPAACDAVVMKALRKDREDRYADAAEMRAALHAALRAPGPGPVRPSTVSAAAAHSTPRPDTGAVRAPRADRQGPGRPGPGQPGAGEPGSRRSRRQPPPSRRPRRGRRAAAVASVAAAVIVVLAVLGGLHAMRSAANATGTTVVAPDLRGKSVTQARRAVLSRHLRVASVLVGSCAPVVVERRVCDQQPAPGTHVASGSGVTLRVSPRSLRMP